MPGSTVPLLAEAALKETLERIRQARPLGDTPLRKLLWFHQQVETQGYHNSPVGVDVGLSSILLRLIEEGLGELRAVEGLAQPESQERAAALDGLRRDFQQANAELEAWSLLYYRYVCIALDLQIQQMAQELGLSARQINRRLSHGVRRLTEHISQLEADARRADWQQWLQLKLPSAAYVELFGIEDEIAQLCAVLCRDGPPHAVALTGPGGIGKTTLAHAATGEVLAAGGFEDFVWLELELLTDFNSLLASIARDLGFLYLAQAAPDELEAGLRVRLAGTKTLLVIDNAGLIEGGKQHLSRLVSLVGPGFLLLIAREQLWQEAPIQLWPVKALPPEDFAAYLKSVARLKRIPQASRLDDETLQTLYDVLGGNPQAGRLVISQMRWLPLPRILEKLTHNGVNSGDVFDELFGPLWDNFSGAARKVAVALYLLPSHGGYWAELAAMSGLEPADLDRGLEELVSSSFVETNGYPLAYRLPPLARLFAKQMVGGRDADRRDYEEMLQRALERELDEDGNLPTDLAHTLTLVNHAQRSDQHVDTIVKLVQRIAPDVRSGGQWAAWRDTLMQLKDCLSDQDTPREALADVWLELGIAYRWLGEHDAAIKALEFAGQDFGLIGNFLGQAKAMLEIGNLQAEAGGTAPAQAAYMRAGVTARRLKDRGLYIEALNGLATLALRGDHVDVAIDLLNRALAEAEDDPDARTLSTLGVAYLTSHAPDRAIEYQYFALELFQAEGDYPHQARTHLRLGMAYYEVGLQPQAARHLDEGLTLMMHLGDALGQARVLNNLGALYARQEQWADAARMWQDALTLQHQLDDRIGMAYTWYNLADLQWQMGHIDAAQAAWGQSAELAEQLQLVTLLSRLDEHPLRADPLLPPADIR